MSFNVAQFRAQLQGDGARPNLFEVRLNFPSFVVPNVGQAMTKATFMCKTSSLPGSSLGVVSLPYLGRDIKVAGNRTFQEWTTTIINDEDFVVRRAVEQWMNGLNSHSRNLRNPAFRNMFGYTVDAEVFQYGKTGQVIKSVQIIGIFPTDLSPIDLDWGSNDAIEEFSVTWQVQEWRDIRSGVV